MKVASIAKDDTNVELCKNLKKIRKCRGLVTKNQSSYEIGFRQANIL